MAIRLGLHSPRLDAVRALKTKAGRREQGRFLIEGPTLLSEALDPAAPGGGGVEAIYCTDEAYHQVRRLAPALDDRVAIVPRRALERLSDLETAPGIVAVVLRRLVAPGALLAEAAGRPVLWLAGVGDPGNAGTLLRSAEIFGFAGAVFGEDGVEPHNPKVVRGSMGAIFRLPLAIGAPPTLVAAAGAAGYQVAVAAADGTPLERYEFPERIVLAVGNERRGFTAPGNEPSGRIAIPQQGRGESLNAAVAGSILMYEVARRRSHASAPSQAPPMAGKA